jgi:hypothetical protein
VSVFRLKVAIEDAIEFHVFAPLEASMRVTNNMPVELSTVLPVGTVNSVTTLKVHTVRQELPGLNFEPGAEDHGQFLMAVEDFVANYDHVYTGNVLDDVYRNTEHVSGKWENGCNEGWRNALNPKFVLKFDKTKAPAGGIGLHIAMCVNRSDFDQTGKRGTAIFICTPDMLTKTSQIHTKHLLHGAQHWT